MTDYKAIKGKTILNLALDLGNSEGEGEVWFNTTSNDFKTILAGGAWASGGNLNDSRMDTAGCGTQTAALCFGGDSPGITANSEEYNGSAWTEGNDLDTAREDLSGCGTQTAGLAFAGKEPSVTVESEEYNGTSWTEGNNLPTALAQMTGLGLQTAAIAAGGYPPTVDTTSLYDGSSWTAGPSMNTVKYAAGGSGSQTAGLVFGGYSPPLTPSYLDITEEFDGSSWTESGDLTLATHSINGGGTQIATMATGGDAVAPTGVNLLTQIYNGVAWAAGPSMTQKRASHGHASQAPVSTSMAFGGSIPAATAATEEYAHTTFAAAGSWASGGTINTARHQMGSAGESATSGITFGGNTTAGTGTPYVIKDESEEYDGTSWTEGNDLNTARANLAGAGVQTAALGIGGQKGTSNDDAEEVESYDGTSWTEVSDLNTARMELGSFGTQTAAFAICGLTRETSPVADKTLVESWDGTSWTETTDIGSARYGVAAAGTTAGGIIAGGENNASSPYALSEEWNGSAWAEGNDLNSGRIRVGGFGSSADTAVAVGGRSGSSPGGGWGEHDDTEEFDGTSWAEKNDLSTGRAMTQGAGVHTTGFLAGGNLGPSGPNTGITEEWVKAQNVKTITD